MAPKTEEEKQEEKATKEPMTEEEIAEVSQYDLTSKLTPFLDKHLILPILHFLTELGIYSARDIKMAEVLLLKDTYMVDFAKEIYEDLGIEPAEGLDEKRDDVLQQLEDLRAREMSLLSHLEDDDDVKKMSNLKSVSEICEQFEVTNEQVEGLVTYAKCQFECGNYRLSGELLKHYRSLVDKDSERAMTSKSMAVTWGTVACAILSREGETAAENIGVLDEYFKDAKMAKREVLLQRTWLVHWCLFPIFQSESVPTKALDIFLHEKSLSIISLSCPQLFRYVGACLVLHKRLRLALKEIVWTINLETGNYSDPITRFLVALFQELDFDEAQRQLQECSKVCKADYFLAHHWDEFQENARLLIFETYCRIHQCIDIDMIAGKLNMTPIEAELWIVKLIQNAKLEARIDSAKKRVIMSKPPPNVYHQVIEKTKNLSFRSSMLLSNLEKRENEKKGIVC